MLDCQDPTNDIASIPTIEQHDLVPLTVELEH